MTAAEDRWVVALASLPLVGPSRLRSLLGLVATHGGGAVWDAVRAGMLDPSDISASSQSDGRTVLDRWSAAAQRIDPQQRWEAHVAAGVGLAVHGSPAYPAVLVGDDDPPPIVFWQGDIDALAGARVGIVGTRRATRYGVDVAHSFAAGLSLAGVAVVSGLALGIDGAAHRAAVAVDGAPPIAVVGSGLDTVYPRANRALWHRVIERGVVLSEYPLGTPAAAWRFPARNRIIAALSDVVVVVESQSTGGALGTAVEAARRARPVFAVPGPVTAPSSAGTNQLLFDGCAPARSVDDVLLALGRTPRNLRVAADRRPVPTGDAARVLSALPWHAIPLERVVVDTGLALGVVALALDALEHDGWIVQRSGWIERVSRGGM